MDLHLGDNVCAVVGGAQGIGAAIVRMLAAESAAVAILDRDLPQTTKLVTELQKQQRRVLGLHVDVRDLQQVRQAQARIHAELGPTQRLFVTAGVGSGKYGFPFWNLSPEDWAPVWEVNVMGVVHVLHTFAPVMTASLEEGSIVLFASVAAQIGSQTDPPYSAAKAAVINFAQCAARDLAPHNIRVNVVAPGMVQTPLNRSVWQAWVDLQRRQGADSAVPSYEQWGAEKVRRVAPLGRWQTVEDIAAMAVFLASPLAGNMTGQTINVDGGQVMR